MEEEIQEPFQKARMMPAEWFVQCPCCGNQIIIDACENDDGSWHADNGDQFPRCEECDALIEVLPVIVMDYVE